MDSLEQKIEEFKDMLLDTDYPLGIDEILGQIEYIYEDNEEISKIIGEYIDGYYKMLSCAEKFYRVKDLIDEEFYSESKENDINL